MKFFTTTLLAASVAIAAPGCPAPGSNLPAAKGQVIGIQALRSGGDLHYTQLYADHHSFTLAHEYDQHAKCVKESDYKAAQFVVTADGELHLYSLGIRQQVYVNEKDENGHAAIGFVTGYVPNNVELKGWSIEQNGEAKYLKFKGKDLIACPRNATGTYNIFGQPETVPYGCQDFSARVSNIENPISCLYE